MEPTEACPDPNTARWVRRVERERRARIQAEDLLEAKSLELYTVNQSLAQLASELEQRVEDRTRELAAARERAVTLSERDQLTGLANRMCFGCLLEDSIARAVETEGRFALFLIDIDSFKDINDSFGHETGDAFLRDTAGRLKAATRSGDVAARLGGDEFAAIVSDLQSTDDLIVIADRMLAASRMPVVYRERLFEASCSIGIAIFPDDAVDLVELQRFADLALYKSKAAGRDRYTLFDMAMKRDFEARHLLGADLRDGIATGAVQPWFQPIVETKTGKLVGVEALARWFHPTRGMLPPNLFLGLAEERGMMGELFATMVRTACGSAKRWIDRGLIRSVSINVSPSQFRTGSFADTVFALLDELKFPPEALTLEITEELLLLDLDRAAVQLEQLARGGIRIALDDFGIGYSNIAYLRRLPIHIIKVDRSLTSDITADPKARSVLGAIIDIAQALDLDMVAEGVEEEDQAAWLLSLGCTYAQGYLFGRPMAADTFDARVPAMTDQPCERSRADA